MQILLTGGSGLLGAELLRLDDTIIAPSSADLDIADGAAVTAILAAVQPDIICHAAAITNNREIESDPRAALKVNIAGTANIAASCIGTRTRLVYLSTDYVYPGESGNFSESDALQPANLYAWTKLAGEAAVRAVPNHLIIRTSFGRSSFDYPAAFEDKWSSKEYVDIIAPDILAAVRSPLTGVVNLGGPRRTLFEYAKVRNPQVKSISRQASPHRSPADTSLDQERWLNFKNGKDVVRGVTECRVCSSSKLVKYLDLGLLPMANNLAPTAAAAKDMDRYPMQVLYCEECSLSQLSVVVDPSVLFSHYTYRSSVNQGYIRHCKAMAKSTGAALNLSPDDLVVDIAGNDGALLNQFREALGVKVLNVDPASNISEIARAAGIPTLNEFWSADVAQTILEEYQRPKLVTATNVFAHVDDVRGFVDAVRACLHENGALMLEFPYAVDFIEEREFDTIYFEHLSYVLLGPVQRLAREAGLEVFDVQKQDIHGGTVRVFIGHAGMHEMAKSVQEFIALEQERGFHDAARYLSWNREIDDLIEDLATRLKALKASGARVAAFAASAKGNTLLNACRLDINTIEYIVDDTPEKIGKFSPGNGIPIVDRDVMKSSPPDYLLILSWNFAREIMATLGDFSGDFILPIPEFRIVENNDD